MKKGKINFINPDKLVKNPVFSNVAVVSGPVNMVYVGGQDAVDAQGNIVGKGDIKAQAQQILKNLEIALSAAGATFEHVIKWNVYVVQGQLPQPAIEVFQPILQKLAAPPLITVVYVAALAHPDFLMEVDAIAGVPQQTQ